MIFTINIVIDMINNNYYRIVVWSNNAFKERESTREKHIINNLGGKFVSINNTCFLAAL